MQSRVATLNMSQPSAGTCSCHFRSIAKLSQRPLHELYVFGVAPSWVMPPIINDTSASGTLRRAAPRPVKAATLSFIHEGVAPIKHTPALVLFLRHGSD
ncbi:hypothetical protein J6590_002447 [Homalodisca vitripennis]|nr:hypothetical protein J6590_002447 [Homalodisca vitripennis]